MKKINIRRLYYHVSHKYFTLNYVVMAIAFLIAAGWVWGSLGVLQSNYKLQKQLDYKKQQLQLAQLQTTNLQLEQSYYKSTEYQDLAAREDLGLVSPGERELILPPNSQAAINADTSTASTIVPPPQTSNFQQWTNFLLGGNSKSISGE